MTNKNVLVGCAFGLILGIASSQSAQLQAELGSKAPPFPVVPFAKGGPPVFGGPIHVVRAISAPDEERQLATLSRLRDSLASNNVQFTAVLRAKTLTEARHGLERMGQDMTLQNVTAQNAILIGQFFSAVGVSDMNAAVIIGTNGNIVWRGPGKELEARLRSVIAGEYSISREQQSAVSNSRRTEYFATIKSRGRTEGSDRLGREIVETIKDDSEASANFAWDVIQEQHLRPKDRDLALAFQAASNAYKKSTAAEIAKTYAYALSENGKRDEALDVMDKAIKESDDKATKDKLTRIRRSIERRRTVTQ